MKITVTTTDHETGDTETMELRRGSYILTLPDDLDLVNEQIYANGTRILTIKRVAEGESE